MILDDTLLTNGAPSGYDWVYPWTADPAAEVRRLQSRFIWAGVSDPNEHGIVAFTQGAQAGTINSPSHAPRSQLWQCGIGAFVMAGGTGVGIELWNMPTGALWWTQANPSAGGVTLPIVPLAQAAQDFTGSFISSNPGFSLQAGVAYWLRAALTKTGGGYVRIRAELFVGASLVQVAQMGVVEASWLTPGCTSRATIARALGSSAVKVDAFDYF